MEETVFSPSGSNLMSDDIRALAKDFLLAKREFRATGKSAHNAHQKYDYANIADIYDAVEDALGNHNIVIWHYADEREKLLYTRLVHTLTGQYIQDIRILESEKPGNQAKGAANTYMKKYAVLSLCSIAQRDEDDDGQAEERYIEAKKDFPLATYQYSQLLAELNDSSNKQNLLERIYAFYKVKDITELEESTFPAVMSYIKKYKKQ